MKGIKKILFNLLLAFVLLFTFGCSEEVRPEVKPDPTPIPEPQPDPEPKVEEKRFRENYNPTLFTYESHTEEKLTDGLILFSYTIKKNNGDTVVIRELEVDLNKVTINAGTKDNKAIGFNYSKTTPYQAGQAFTNETGKKVYATLNADFFGSMCVNAFVKDGYIVKDSHNDNNNYDYQNTASDVPASAPMLFGVKGNTALVAPIKRYVGDVTTSSVKKELIQSKLKYEITSGIKSIETSDTFKLVTSSMQLNVGDMYAIIDLSNGLAEAEVVSVSVATIKSNLDASANRAFIYCSSNNSDGLSFLNSIKKNSKINVSVKSPDGLWDGYKTILGCRQALVINNQIADTVTLENTNGAQSGDIPRSSVGVNIYGKVCIYAIESMYYGRKANENDTHGVSLPILAEFMYYNNIKDGANFDGGGSTQLIVKKDGTDTVVVRSSDTGSTSLKNTRPVMNVIMVTEK